MAVIVLVDLYAKDTPDAIIATKRALLEAAAHYNKEQGTVEWLPVQSKTDKRVFRVFEKFESEEAFQAHRDSPYRQTFVASLKGVLDNAPKVDTFEELV